MQSKQHSPTVSVVIATRNRADLLERTLAGVKAQTLTDLEVVIVDDGSDAEQRSRYSEILKSCDSRFRMIAHAAAGAPGTGPSRARNRGLKHARGMYVAFCDDDDVWTAVDHLEVAVRTLTSVRGMAFFADMQGQNAGEITIQSWFPDSSQLTSGLKVSDSPVVFRVSTSSLMRVVRRHYLSMNTCVLSRELVLDIGGFWEGTAFAEDLELTLRLADRCDEFYFRPAPVAMMNATPRVSAFLSTSKIDQAIACIAVAQHARALTRHPDVHACSRAVESWNLRQLAIVAQASHNHVPAARWCLQALVAWPSPGTIGFALRSLVALIRRTGSRGSSARTLRS